MTLAAMVAALNAAAQAVVALPPGLLAGESFHLRETDHFTIAYDTSDDTLRPLVARLEGTYDTVRQFCEAIALTVRPPSERLRVLLFDRYEDFAAYLNRIGVRGGSVAGIYDRQTNIAAFCNADNSPELAPVTYEIGQLEERLRQSGPERSGSSAAGEHYEDLRNRLAELRFQRDRLAARFNQFVLQHETAHQVLFSLGVHVRSADNPTWLVEGVVCLFELSETDEARPMTPINQPRLADFRDALGVPPDARHVTEQAYRAAFAERRLIPLIDFAADSGAFAGPDPQSAFRYAQAWTLVYYLRHERGDAFAFYLRRLADRERGQPVGPRREIDEFRAAFGEPDEAWQRAWVDWTLRLPFNPPEAGR